jgi:hypothetical protein
METITAYHDVTDVATGLDNLHQNVAFLTAAGDYLVCEDSGNAYKVEVDTPVNVTQITKDAVANIGTPYYSAGKRHYFCNAVYDETLGRIYANNAQPDTLYNSKAADVYKTDKTLIFHPGTYYDTIYTMRNNAYIATVNNLQNAVTKDSTQTMKVIYTLTFS